MKKLTKTESALLARIDSDPSKKTCVMSGYRTYRKNGSYGNREHSAMISLVKRGIVKIVSSSNYQDCCRTYTDNWTESVIARV